MKRDSERVQVLHQIDSIYCGEINSSYQKDGFGIQQTLNFDTYIGNWRLNKADGKGIVVLADGTIIYAHFNRDQIDGISIFDNGETLRCGIYRNGEITGIGFEYKYERKLWAMSKYHKGVAVETIKEEVCDIYQNFPKIINIEQSLFFHLYSYVKKDYFSPCPFDAVTVQAEEANNSRVFFCLKNKDGFYGPGVAVKQFKIMEVGFYEKNELNGYGIKNRYEENEKEYGLYLKGRKDGFFCLTNKNGERFCEFHKDSIIKQLGNEKINIYQKQKRHNYNQKDFFSCKSTFNFEKLYDNQSKTSKTSSKIGKGNGNGNETNRKQMGLLSTRNLTHTVLTPRTGRSTGSFRDRDAYIVTKAVERSSVQIMREKINLYLNPSLMKKKEKKVDKIGEELSDGEIANEENPFGIL